MLSPDYEISTDQGRIDVNVVHVCILEQGDQRFEVSVFIWPKHDVAGVNHRCRKRWLVTR